MESLLRVLLAFCICPIAIELHFDVTRRTGDSISAGIYMSFATFAIYCSFCPSIETPCAGVAVSP